MSWSRTRKKWDWRAFLEPGERQIIERADASREKIRKAQAIHEEKFGRDVQIITNRAIQRAKYAAGAP